MTTKTKNTITIDLDSLESVAAAIKLGITTPQQIVDVCMDYSLVEGCAVRDDAPWICRDEHSEVEYDSDEYSAEDAAEEFLSGWESEEVTSTIWPTCRVFRQGVDDTGEIVRVDEERHGKTIDPPEPECVDGGQHRWETPYELVGGCKENPGVWGSGGGVKMESVCTRCGCARMVDTWAQNPANGEQGLESTSYEEGKYADEVEIMHCTRASEDLSAERVPGGWKFEDADGNEWKADKDEMQAYGLALLDGEDADLPGKMVECEDEDED